MADDRVRRRVVIRGRVQGVFFRDSIRQRAHARDVAGWVRNRVDGTVEAVFEGKPYDVEQLVRYAETGPPQAEVQSVDVRDEEPEGLTGFEIR
ncbi:MAG TPA: acylphosphatase [Solirubrobacteraceae bacterium]|nr:acylphosphatase [Solirubrobacteraceae bacterium]